MTSNEQPDKPIDFSETTADERLALVGLAMLMMQQDGRCSFEEMESLRQFTQLGPDELNTLQDRVTELLKEEEAAQNLANFIIRQEVRELVYGLLFEIATHHMIVEREAALLELIQSIWNLESQQP